MAKQLRIEDPDLVRRAQDADVIIIGGRSYVLVEDAVGPGEGGPYEPTSDEAAMLREAAADPRPGLQGPEVDAYLSRRRRELGLDR